MSAARDRLLDALAAAGCAVSNGGNAATCPAHDDRAPSLSIGPRRDGDGVILRCHAGCDTLDVLAALGMAPADLFDAPRQTSRARPEVVAHYDYTDEHGALLFQKLRYCPKDFRQRRPEGTGWSWKLGDVRRVLYRLPEVLRAVAAGETVYVCEGEKDADALASLGVTATTWTEGAWGVGQGAKWRREYTETLTDAHVVVVADRDDAGRDTADGIACEVGRVAAAVTVVEAATGKDAADHIAAGRALGDLVPVQPVATVEAIDEPPSTSPPTGGKASVATQLVQLALSRWRFAVSSEGDPFALPLHGAQVARMLTGGSRSLRSELADAFAEETGKVAGAQALADAILTLEGRARRGDPVPLALRFARGDDGALWLDLGEVTGRAVRITPDGWAVVDEPNVLFRRSALTGALPEPVRGGDLAELWSLVNVAPESRPLLLAWLVAALDPTIPHPIAVLIGEQGTGKSTASRSLTQTLDPSPAQLRKPPRDVEQWVTAAQGSAVVGVDNVSTIAEWWSDSLCRAVTGDGDVRRRLYSDGDLSVFAFRRTVLLNGIDLGAVRDDLADRLMVIELHRITGRRSDAELSALGSSAHPRVLGALLDLAVRVLAVLPTVHLTDPPRMVDFALVLAAVDQVLGTAGLGTYVRLADDLAADAVTSDPVLAAVVEHITESWSGTAAELLTTLGDGSAHGKAWPASARAMTGLLRRRAPSLRRLGWTVEDLGRGGHAMVIRFHIEPPHAGDSAGDAGDSAGDAGDSRRQAGDSSAVACGPAPDLTCENVEKAGDAGDAGVPTPPFLLPRLRREEESAEHTHDQIPPGLSPASPASPATSATSATGPPPASLAMLGLDLGPLEPDEPDDARCQGCGDLLSEQRSAYGCSTCASCAEAAAS